MVVNDELKEPIRDHRNIEQGNAKFMKTATKYYDALSVRASSNGHAIDIYVCALDQVGIFEMKSICNSTGGHLVMADSFLSSLFKQSYEMMFSMDSQQKYNMAFNAIFEVKTSTRLKVCGTIGPCVSMNVKGPNVSETNIGISGTSQWKFCALNSHITAAVFFEIVNQVRIKLFFFKISD